MRIILFGGSFNPIHNGHIEAARLAMEKIGARKVIFIPSFEPFDEKQNNDFVDPSDRLKMIQEVIKNIPNFFVDDIEIRYGKKCYTIDVVKYFRKKYYADDLYLILGYDQLLNFTKWKDYNEILKIVSILCVKRGMIDVNKLEFSPHDYLFIDSQYNTISSTGVRENMCINNIPYRALKYINENGIYLKSRLLPFISEKRFKHSLRVAIMAYETMKLYDKENALKGWVAGAYHDICKEFGEQQLERLAYRKYRLPKADSWKILHGPVAKYLLMDIFKFDDEMVLNAIANHTKPDLDSELTVLDKVLYCCDKLEPLRTEKDLKDIGQIRKLLKTDLDKAFKKIVDTCETMYNPKEEE